MNPLSVVAGALTPIVEVFTGRQKTNDLKDAAPVAPREPVGAIDWDAAYKNDPAHVKNPHPEGTANETK